MKLAIKRVLKCTAALIFVIILLLGIRYIAVPISRPHDSVRKYVLGVMPVGTSWDDCLQCLEDKDWEVVETSDYGLNVNYGAKEAHIADEADIRDGVKFSYRQIVGDQSMLVYLGSYHNPLITDVYANIAFDENGELIDLFIRKDIDSL